MSLAERLENTRWKKLVEGGGRLMLSGAQWLGPSHFVVFVQTGKTWEVVQACCNKTEILYLSLQRLNTTSHITTAGRGDLLSPVPKGSGLLLSLLSQWLPANMGAKVRDVPLSGRSNPAPLSCAQPTCCGRGTNTFLETCTHHAQQLFGYTSLPDWKLMKCRLWNHVRRLWGCWSVFCCCWGS